MLQLFHPQNNFIIWIPATFSFTCERKIGWNILLWKTRFEKIKKIPWNKKLENCVIVYILANWCTLFQLMRYMNEVKPQMEKIDKLHRMHLCDSHWFMCGSSFIFHSLCGIFRCEAFMEIFIEWNFCGCQDK